MESALVAVPSGIVVETIRYSLFALILERQLRNDLESCEFKLTVEACRDRRRDQHTMWGSEERVNAAVPILTFGLDDEPASMAG